MLLTSGAQVPPPCADIARQSGPQNTPTTKVVGERQTFKGMSGQEAQQFIVHLPWRATSPVTVLTVAHIRFPLEQVGEDPGAIQWGLLNLVNAQRGAASDRAPGIDTTQFAQLSIRSTTHEHVDVNHVAVEVGPVFDFDAAGSHGRYGKIALELLAQGGFQAFNAAIRQLARYIQPAVAAQGDQVESD